MKNRIWIVASSACVLVGGVVGCSSGPAPERASSQQAAWHWTPPYNPPPSADGGSSGPSAGAVVACGNGGDPTATCSAPEHCCFTNYTASHDGYCTTDACLYGTIDCDGPEDCGDGQVCCMNGVQDPIDGTTTYHASCQATACPTTALVHELCHAGAASSGACSDPKATCVSAGTADYDLPRDLDICN